MTKRSLTCAALFLALELTGDGGKAVPARAQALDANVGSDSGLNVIVALPGQVIMKRKGWSAFAPAMPTWRWGWDKRRWIAMR